MIPESAIDASDLIPKLLAKTLFLGLVEEIHE